jgi:DnaJ-class molecular chaperone
VEVDECYDELGLAPGSSDAEVKAAWRRLSARWHPDRNDSPQALRKIQRINRALDGIRMARQVGAETDRDGDAAGPAVAEHTVSLTLEEVATGCTRDLRGEIVGVCAGCAGSGLKTQPAVCRACNGAGLVRQHLWFAWMAPPVKCGACQGLGATRQPCAACDGSGKAPAQRYRGRATIPPGARPGQVLDVAARYQGGQRKDQLLLRVRLEVQPHPLFSVEADGTVKCEVPVDGFAWMADRWVDVPTPLGLRQMKLRRGALGYRIKGAGLPWQGDGSASDCLITVVPLFPQEFSPAQEAAIDQLMASNSGQAGSSAGARMTEWHRVLARWERGVASRTGRRD